MSFYAIAWLVVLLPLFGWVASYMAVTARRSAQISLAFCGLSLIVAAALLAYRGLHQSAAPYESVVSFWEVRPQESGVFATTLTPMFGVRVDALSTALMAVVAFISAVVQWHAMALMRADPESRRLFQVMALFTAAVLALIASPNLFQFWVMWEVVAVAAFVLAGHWWTSVEAATGARRMFLYLRVGDLALFFGVIFTFIKFGPHASSKPAPAGSDVSDPFSFAVLSGSSVDPSHAGEWHIAHTGFVLGVGLRTLVLLGGLFFLAAAVRACQFPFQAWLTEATGGPPPATTLLASLLASSGVVLVARMYPLFLEVPHLLTVVACVGAASAALCALAALAQRDLVRLAVLISASQLGLVLVGFGTGGFSRPLFALVVTMMLTALLLVVVSNTVRAYRTQEIDGIAGMWPRMRWTSVGLMVWAAGLCGAGLVNYNILASVFHNTSPVGTHVGNLARAGVVIAALLGMVGAATCGLRLAMRVLTGTPVPRRGLQPERIVEGEPRLRHAMMAIVSATVLAVVVGAIPRVGLEHFVFYGDHPQILDWDPTATLVSLVVVAIAATVALRIPTARVSALRGGWDIAPALARWVSVPLGHLSGTVLETDAVVLDGVAGAMGQGMVACGDGAGRAVTHRVGVQLGVGLGVAGALAAGTVLAATGHLPGWP